MEQRAASVFDTCLEQALQDAEPLMASMCNAALASLRVQLLDPSNAHNEPLLRQAQSQLQSKKASLPAAYAHRLRQAAFLIAEGKRADYHQLMGGEALSDGNGLESEVLRAQIEWGRVQINLLQQTEQSLMGLERVYRPLRKITRYWRNGNPLHHTLYLDRLQATFHDQGITTDVTSLFLSDMVGVMADHLQTSYHRIMHLAMNSYAELLAKAEAKKRVAKDNTRSFAHKARGLFNIPAHCPVGAVRAYKMLIPVMERLALQDETFWLDSAHPSRVLTQTIINKATALKEGGGHADPQFPSLVSDAVETLSALREPKAADFANALERFGVSVKPRAAVADGSHSGYSSSMLAESQWGASDLMSISPESGFLEPITAMGGLEGAVSAPVPLAAAPVVGSAKLTLDRMEQDVMEMVAMSVHSFDADPAVLTALTNAWPKVLLQAAQRAGEDSPHFRAYKQVVPQVLALAGANAGVGVHSEADVLIPSLLTRLKSGLTGIGWMPERIAPVLTAVAHMAPSAIVELQSVQEEEVAPVALRVQEPFVMDAAVAKPMSAVAVTGKEVGNVLHIAGQAIQTGVRLAFLSQGEWVTKELSWTNAQSTMFLFTAGDGASQSITRRMLEKMVQEHAVRPV